MPAQTDKSPKPTPASRPETLPEADRCRFTSTHGRHCSYPHQNSLTGLCFMHERRQKKLADDEARAISDELLSSGTRLNTRQDLNPVMSKLFCLVSQKRISRLDGALLAYIASLLLQTIPPPPENIQPKINWEGFLDQTVRSPRDRDQTQQPAEHNSARGYQG